MVHSKSNNLPITQMNFLRTKLVEYVMAKGLKSVSINTFSPEGQIQFTLKHTSDKQENELSRSVFVDLSINSNAEVTINLKGKLGTVKNIFFANNTIYVDPYFRLSRYLEVVFSHIYYRLLELKGTVPSRKYHSEKIGAIDYFDDSDIISTVADLMKPDSVLERGRDVVLFKNEEYKKAINKAITFAMVSERNVLIEESSSGCAIRAVPYPRNEDESKTFDYQTEEEKVSCISCHKRGKDWQGSDPKCAFDQNGNFTKDNWACATMRKLRELAYEQDLVQKASETSIASIYVPALEDLDEACSLDDYNGFIVLSWYKNRGNTGSAVFMNDDGVFPLTIKHAERAIEYYTRLSED